MPTSDFDMWGLEDQLASGDLAYQYGGTSYGDTSPGRQPWNVDFSDFTYNMDSGNAWNTGLNFNTPSFNFNTGGGSQQPAMNFNAQPLDFPSYDFPELEQLQFSNPSAYDYYTFGSEYNPESFNYETPFFGAQDVPMGAEQYGMLQDQLKGFGGITDVTGASGWDQATIDQIMSANNEPSLLENIKGGLGGITGLGKALLPFIMMAVAGKSSSNAGNAAKTLQEIAQQQQQQNTEAINRLNNMIATGAGRPDMESYGLNEPPNLPGMSAIQASQNPYLAQLQAAIADPRFGLQEYMDAEGGRRAEAAARQMARGGRTGLAPMTSLEAMRDYLSKGRPQRIGEMQNLSQLYSQQDIARMNAEAQMQAAQMSGAVSMYNAQMNQAANRYNADMGYYRDVLNVLQRQSDPGNYINTMLAAAQAQGQQYNPLLNSIAYYLGQP